jgi:chemotaxis response regulator CheB
MPKVARQMGAVELEVPLSRLAEHVLEACSVSR